MKDRNETQENEGRKQNMSNRRNETKCKEMKEGNYMQINELGTDGKRIGNINQRQKENRK